MGAPVFSGPGEGRTVKSPGVGSVNIRARGEGTDGAVSVFESIVPPGEGPPLHVHAEDEELIYVLEGRVRFRLADAEHDGPPGSFVFSEAERGSEGFRRFAEEAGMEVVGVPLDRGN